jgi:hypothetical protein
MAFAVFSKATLISSLLVLSRLFAEQQRVSFILVGVFPGATALRVGVAFTSFALRFFPHSFSSALFLRSGALCFRRFVFRLHLILFSQ